MKTCKTCKTCKVDKESSEFGNNKHSKDKLNYVCNPCRADYELQRRISKGIKPKVKPVVLENQKECLMCKQILPLDHYGDNKRGRLGKNCYCVDCFPKYHINQRNLDVTTYRENRRISTQKYRDSHREHWRGLHRINQFNRKNLIKAVDDGTVTESFMKALYDIDKCYWCGNLTPENKRTAEHIIPLISGGIHGVSNLTMACSTCNSSKRNFKL
jgi:hypothetical protein